MLNGVISTQTWSRERVKQPTLGLGDDLLSSWSLWLRTEKEREKEAVSLSC